MWRAAAGRACVSAPPRGRVEGRKTLPPPRAHVHLVPAAPRLGLLKHHRNKKQNTRSKKNGFEPLGDSAAVDRLRTRYPFVAIPPGTMSETQHGGLEAEIVSRLDTDVLRLV